MTIPPHVWDAYWSDVKPGTEAALERVVAAMSLPPTAFEWTPAMQAIWPAEMRPTMSGLLAIWEAMQEAAVYDTPKPLADDGWIEHDGGEQPVPNGTKVNVKFGDGGVDTTDLDASEWWWKTMATSSGTIVAYRVVS